MAFFCHGQMAIKSHSGLFQGTIYPNISSTPLPLFRPIKTYQASGQRFSARRKLCVKNAEILRPKKGPMGGRLTVGTWRVGGAEMATKGALIMESEALSGPVRDAPPMIVQDLIKTISQRGIASVLLTFMW